MPQSTSATILTEPAQTWTGECGVLAIVRSSSMGTRCSVRVVAETEGTAISIADGALATVSELDQLWSRFREDSELSELNRIAANAPSTTTISPLTGALVNSMLWAYRFSGGLVDASVLPAVVAAGYDSDYAALTTEGDTSALDDLGVVEPLPAVGMAGIHCDGASVQFDEPVALDSGGIGKGLAADLVAEACIQAGASGVIVDLGGDMRIAGRDEHGVPWRVSIADELDVIGEPVGTWLVDQGGVATSSTTRRTLRHGHHLVDPRTGQPSSTDLLAATVHASTSAMAECLAKAAILLGLSAAVAFLTLNHAKAMLTCRDGMRYTVRAVSPPAAWALQARSQSYAVCPIPLGVSQVQT